MKGIIFRYGSIAGVVIIGSMVLSVMLAGERAGESATEWVGYLIMLVALSLIFLGVKNYRDEELGGVIRFGTGLAVGIGITLVASVIYVAAWEVYLSVTDYAFIGDYTASVIAEKEAAGVTGAELEAEMAEMTQLTQRYGNPVFRIPITFLEIFPVGLLISLLSAGILRNSKVLPMRA